MYKTGQTILFNSFTNGSVRFSFALFSLTVHGDHQSRINRLVKAIHLAAKDRAPITYTWTIAIADTMSLTLWITLIMATSIVAGQEVPMCSGSLEQITIDFETDRRGRPLKTGQIPHILPGGLRAKGKKKLTSRKFHSDLMIHDTRLGSTNSSMDSAGNVLILNQNENSTSPVMSDEGGKVIFRFREPVFQVTSIRLLNIGNRRGNAFARTVDSATALREWLPVSPDLVIRPSNWFGVRKIRFNLRGKGAIASLNVTRCRIPKAPGCGAGLQVSEDGKGCQIPATFKRVGDELPGSPLKETFGQAGKISGDGTTLVVGNGQYVRVYQRHASFPGGWRQVGGDIDQAASIVDISNDGKAITLNGSPNGCDIISAYKYYSSDDDWFASDQGGVAIFAQDVR